MAVEEPEPITVAVEAVARLYTILHSLLLEVVTRSSLVAAVKPEPPEEALRQERERILVLIR